MADCERLAQGIFMTSAPEVDPVITRDGVAVPMKIHGPDQERINAYVEHMRTDHGVELSKEPPVNGVHIDKSARSFGFNYNSGDKNRSQWEPKGPKPNWTQPANKDPRLN